MGERQKKFGWEFWVIGAAVIYGLAYSTAVVLWLWEHRWDD